MFRQRPVAGFAVHVRFLAFFLRVKYVDVAGFASLMAGKMNCTRGDLAGRSSAIVAVLPKAFGDNVAANHPKQNKGEDKKPRESKKMSCILQDAHPAQSH